MMRWCSYMPPCNRHFCHVISPAVPRGCPRAPQVLYLPSIAGLPHVRLPPAQSCPAGSAASRECCEQGAAPRQGPHAQGVSSPQLGAHQLPLPLVTQLEFMLTRCLPHTPLFTNLVGMNLQQNLGKWAVCHAELTMAP